MDQIFFTLAGMPITLLHLLVAVGGLLLVALIILVRLQMRAKAWRQEAQHHAKQLESTLSKMNQAQAEMTGRMQTMAEIFGTRTSDLAKNLGDRIDGVSHRMGQSLHDTKEKTDQNLSKLHERLAVIDRAQAKMTDLSCEIVSLQSILQNKQTRGAFGQGRMEAIIADALPERAYEFQATLSNNMQPDCLIHLPNGAPRLVVDAKFPLEGWQALQEAKDEISRKQALSQFRQAIGKHIKAMSDKYLIPGETHDTAFLFVPSESIFADIQSLFPDMVQKASRARIVIVSPSLLVLSIQVVQALLRDVKMREQAHLIQSEVQKMLDDVRRLDERVDKLTRHFEATRKDLDDITTSSKKVKSRGDKLLDFDMGEAPEVEASSAQANLQLASTRQ